MARTKFAPKRLLVVHAHPDDESLFTGHVIAKAVADKAEVMVLTLTRGERGRVKLEELKALEGDLAAMGAFRASELKNALKALGVANHKFAGTRAYLDSGMRISAFGKPAKPKNLDERALSAVSVAVIAEDVYRTIVEFKPDTVLTYNRHGGFGHPDHKMAHQASMMAVRRYAKENKRRAPEFWVIAEDGERFDDSIGNAKTAAVKKSALEAHASQVAVNAETYSITSGKELRYDTPEKVRKSSTKPWMWVKPTLIALWSLPLGVLMAIAGTMLHSVTASDPDKTPLGLWVALIMIGALALALRMLRKSRGALYLMTLTLASTLYWMSHQTTGDFVLGHSEIDKYWRWGSLIICFVVILFPRIHPGVWRKSARGHR
jgi:N-acetyl-1-D-myo-inositol-2-amino-2-deoxy-alpha-D-glucopyranoside deacetylase